MTSDIFFISNPNVIPLVAIPTIMFVETPIVLAVDVKTDTNLSLIEVTFSKVPVK